MTLRAIVTAGGTTEHIDDVRTVSNVGVLGLGDDTTQVFEAIHLEIANISGGEFGIQIARALATNGVETTLILRSTAARALLQQDCPFTVRKFTTTADLDKTIREELSKGSVDLLFMAAAVSDYTPFEATSGKISSDQEEIVVRLRANPKILPTLREQAPGCFIVGFKLLSGVSVETLERIALEQIRKAGTDLCVANDLQQIDWENKIHPIRIVHPDGLVVPQSGPRKEVSEKLVQHVLRLAEKQALP